MYTHPSKDIPLCVVMRSYNDAAILPRTLAGLRAQTGVDVRLIVFESASTDYSPEILACEDTQAMVHLEPGTYHSSDVLNRGMMLADTEYVACVNSDAVMTDPLTLRRLVDATRSDPRCAGAFAAQDVRPDANQMTRLDHQIAFADRDQLGAGAEWMSMVCSVVRRRAWEEVGFDLRLTFAEDAVWSETIRQRGWCIRFVPQARCEHSHDYSWRQRYRRAYGDASALAVIRDQPPARTVLGGVIRPLARRLLKDSWRLLRNGQPFALFSLPWHRMPQLLGAWHGARDGWMHVHACHHESSCLQPTPGMVGN